MYGFGVRLLLSVLSAELVRAVYYIDDTNSTLQYTPPTISGHVGGGGVFAEGQFHSDSGYAFSWNNSGYFNATLTGAFCSTQHGCHLTIPFRGSGITLYGNRFISDLNISITLDGGPPTTHYVTGNADGQYQLNVSLYDIQSLSLADHTLDIALKNTSAQPPLFNASSFYFDYAAVNDTDPNPQSNGTSPNPPYNVTSSDPQHTGTNQNPHNNKWIIGPAVGGAVGAFVVIALVVWVLIHFWRHSHPLNATAPYQERNTAFSDAYPRKSLNPSRHPPPPPILPYTSAAPPESRLPPPSEMLVMANHRASATRPYPAIIPTELPTSFVLAPFSPSTEHPPVGQDAEVRLPTGSADLAVGVVSTRGASGPNGLTSEQAQFIHNLHNLNVPANEIASVMEVMRAQRVGAVGGDIGGHSMSGEDAPPRYEDV